MIRTIATVFALTLTTSAALAAEPDNLILPPGFHAQVVADGIASLRHMAVRDDGVIYASTHVAVVAAAPRVPVSSPCTWTPITRPTRSIISPTSPAALASAIYKGALYTTSTTDIYRFTLKPGEVIPSAAPDVVVTGIAGGRLQQPHYYF